ncbi:hypothetical protein GA0070607_2597 [Micromonospora coriariae]|uniref:Zinc-finger n=1 Tax=Micromonospora coriariae TaxID=285665 RepID=A0A1C4VST6_9ACTN|nr:hypothetical protein [Micromonospora coriariae]SCE87028.1 hypothetical protein GA0070607_2597 [Micromonospora coriariae]
MTTEGYREVDDDLLADYLGGALDGTPQQAEVARLVDTDPAWAEAYALLAPAVIEVRADLARWAEPSPELPPAVADRLAAALAAADPVPNGAPVDSGTADGEAEAGAATPVVVPAQGGSGPGRRPVGPSPADPARGTRTGPGRRRRRWARRAAPVAVAVVALVAVGLGLDQLSMDASDTAGTSAVNRPASTSALNQPASAPDSAVRTTGPSLRSGTDYSPQSLGDRTGGPSPLKGASTSADAQPGVAGEGDRRPLSSGLDQLARLTDDAALKTCLADVAAEHGSAPLVVEVIDYATFRGEPALVIRFTDAAGARWAWVSGPECGVPGSGSDSRYSARVG